MSLWLCGDIKRYCRESRAMIKPRERMFAWREPISGKLIYAMARFSAVAFREEKPQRKRGRAAP
jgi:hypothetical protein